MTEFLSKASLLSAIGGLHEKAVSSPLLGGTVLVRELTARQRLIAREAAARENEDEIDQALYFAMLIQFCVVDPESGTAGPDGTVDPATRRPLLTPQEVATLAEGRALVVDLLVGEITSLSALLPVSLQQGDPAPGRGERGAGQGAGTGRAAAPGAPAAGAGDDDGRGDVAAPPEPGARQAA
jgi:hypothetical protein